MDDLETLYDDPDGLDYMNTSSTNVTANASVYSGSSNITSGSTAMGDDTNLSNSDTNKTSAFGNSTAAPGGDINGSSDNISRGGNSTFVPHGMAANTSGTNISGGSSDSSSEGNQTPAAGDNTSGNSNGTSGSNGTSTSGNGTAPSNDNATAEGSIPSNGNVKPDSDSAPNTTSGGAAGSDNFPTPASGDVVDRIKSQEELIPSEPPVVTKSKMSIGNSTVEVIAEHGIDIAKATGAKHFTDWVSTVAENQDIKISQIHFQTWDAPRSGPQLADFPFESIKFEAKATKYEKKIPGVVLMRGSITSLLVILQHEETSHVLMMRRPRAPVAVSSMLELIEGCIDADGNFIGDGAKELKLKAGIEINESDNSLIKLTAEVYGKRFPGMYPSCGGCDEFNRLLVYRQVMDDAKIDDLKKNLAGQAEGDLLKLELIPLKDLWRKSPDAKALSALCLHDKLIASSEREH
jgi:ADP-sugar diphosphatase